MLEEHERIFHQFTDTRNHSRLTNQKARVDLVIMQTKIVDSVRDALWLASQTPNIFAIYLRATWEKMASWFASVTSKEIIQINFFVVYIVSLF